MVFSSTIFLFLFLPLVLAVYTFLPGLKSKNLWLLATSLVFYAWGEVTFILLLLASTLMNYYLGLWVDRREQIRQRKLAVGIAITLNVGLLLFFKYADFAVNTLNSLGVMLGIPPIPQPHIPLPVGISFFTFHALSYVIDIYRRKWKAATDPKDTALYIFFFPQLIAGPILRWSAIAPQLLERKMSRELFAEGVRRFVGGLSKKMIIANGLAVPADQIFALSSNELTAPLAWFGILCYTLQLYFDFSGYSDMAVGMGKMFGFTFIENFNFPYMAESIRDFWRRWHISLSLWFRDYVYIPLGGNRVSEIRNQLNLFIVFFLCGLWHGANWTFVIWGIYNGIFLILERTRFGTWMDQAPRPVRHLYAIVVIMMGWVVFRANSYQEAHHFYLALFGLGDPATPHPFVRYLSNYALFSLAFGLLFCGPTWAWIKSTCTRIVQASPPNIRTGVQVVGASLETILLVALLMLSIILLAGGTYNPFIYFRF
jgi:alginate O-acetyltransferase complex protein AlgI